MRVCAVLACVWWACPPRGPRRHEAPIGRARTCRCRAASSVALCTVCCTSCRLHSVPPSHGGGRVLAGRGGHCAGGHCADVTGGGRGGGCGGGGRGWGGGNGGSPNVGSALGADDTVGGCGFGCESACGGGLSNVAPSASSETSATSERTTAVARRASRVDPSSSTTMRKNMLAAASGGILTRCSTPSGSAAPWIVACRS